MAPSWVISKTAQIVAKLVPDHVAKRYAIEVHSGVSAAEMAEAANRHSAGWPAGPSDESRALWRRDQDNPWRLS